LTIMSDTDWRLLDRLRTTPATSIVIALLEGSALTIGGVRAVRAGARSVLWRGTSATVLRRTVEATIDGQAVLPAALAALRAELTRSAAVAS
jgi:hypothetical protein